MKCIVCAACLALFAVLVGTGQAQPTLETVVDGLVNPCGLTIQPETGHVFVSDSGGGRILRVVDGQAADVIVGFPQDVYGDGPKYTIGPLGLAFLDKDTLVVGGGGFPDGEELLRIYALPAAGEKPLQAGDMQASFSLAASDERKGEGNFYGVAATDAAIYVTCNGDDAKGWISKADVKGTKVGPFKRFLATKEATRVDAPVAITISPEGYVVVGQMGEISVPSDGLLTFYDKKGKLLLNLKTGLNDVTGLAYSRRSGQLYAIDFAWLDSAQGGLFQVIRSMQKGTQGIEAKKLLSLDKPTAMTFGDDGSLYITVVGTAEEGADAKSGRLIRIAPGL